MLKINWSKVNLLIMDVNYGSFRSALAEASTFKGFPIPARNFEGTSTKDQESYLRSISTLADICRGRGASVTWPTFPTGDKFIAPVEDASVKGRREQSRMGLFFGPLPTDMLAKEQYKNFEKVMEECGPRRCDSAIKKSGFNTLDPNAEGGKDYSKFLVETQRETVIGLGGNADICVVASLLAAAMAGYNVIIVTDLTFWDGNPRKIPMPVECEALIRGMIDQFLK